MSVVVEMQLHRLPQITIPGCPLLPAVCNCMMMGSLIMLFLLLSLLQVLHVIATAADDHSSSGSHHGSSGFQCPKAIFAFADSLTDTGEMVQMFPNMDAANFPYGITFPGYPTGRWCDGRNIIDFLALGMDLPTLTPFTEDISPSFGHGVNFAAAGATARCDSLDPLHVPFCLQAQVDQAISFKKQALVAPKAAHVPGESSFTSKGLYFVLIGGNDIHHALGAGTRLRTIINLIVPELVSNISSAIARLYTSNGARQFLVGNVPPIGCSTYSLTVLNKRKYGPLDANGCLVGINQVVNKANSLLLTAVHQLRESLHGALILHASVHDIIFQLTTHYKAYGFTEPVKACCGSSQGPHNYDPMKRCGTPEADNHCENPSQHISWDGPHFTEAVNRLVANATLTGNALDPPINLFEECSPFTKS